MLTNQKKREPVQGVPVWKDQGTAQYYLYWGLHRRKYII